MLHTKIGLLDDVLDAHQAALADDFDGYRNHTYRVLNLCAAMMPAAALHLEKIAIAAAFHDLGIWTDRTFDYLPPSMALAQAHLAETGRHDWSTEITGMILQHHKITSTRDQGELVEYFRRADWVDVSHGVLRFGLSRPAVQEIFAAWPNAGFHKKLVKLELRRLCSHPLSPLPMMKL